MTKVLDGTIVLELASFISGPYCGLLLADLGAEVWKVEPPAGGDPFRSSTGADYSPQFLAYNRQKRSVALDLARPAGRDALLRLAERADVLVENFRPGVTDKLGIGWDVLHARNPRLIYCAITGFGPSGPYARRPAYDTVAQALSGFLSQTLDPQAPRISGPAMADAVSGLYGAYGVLGALVERGRTGVGRRVDVAMIEAMAAFAAEPYATYFAGRPAPGPYDRAAVSQSFALRCADGGIIGLHLSSPVKFWEGLLRAVGRPELAGDPRFADRAGRVKHHQALQAELASTFAGRPRAEWERILAAADLPYAPVLELPAVPDDPQIRHLGTFGAAVHPAKGEVRYPRRPVHYDGGQALDETAPPTLGEHTRQVLAACGLTEVEIAAATEPGPPVRS